MRMKFSALHTCVQTVDVAALIRFKIRYQPVSNGNIWICCVEKRSALHWFNAYSAAKCKWRSLLKQDYWTEHSIEKHCFFLMNNEAMHVSIFFLKRRICKGFQYSRAVSYFMVIKLNMLFSMEEHRESLYRCGKTSDWNISLSSFLNIFLVNSLHTDWQRGF